MRDQVLTGLPLDETLERMRENGLHPSAVLTAAPRRTDAPPFMEDGRVPFTVLVRGGEALYARFLVPDPAKESSSDE